MQAALPLGPRGPAEAVVPGVPGGDGAVWGLWQVPTGGLQVLGLRSKAPPSSADS